MGAVSGRYVIVVEESNWFRAPGNRFPVPVAVVPLALAPVRAALQERVYRGAVRIAVRKHGPVITDHGNPIVDAWPPDGFDAACGEAELAEPRSRHAMTSVQ